MNSSEAIAENLPRFFSSIWNSATSFQFYNRIVGQSFRRSLMYFVGVAVCLSALLSWRVHHDLTRSLSDWASWLSATLPDIKIVNGIATIAPDQPKHISDGAAVLILDPTDIPAPIDEKFRTGMVLAKDKVILKWNQTRGPAGDVSRLEKLIYVCAYTATLTQPQAFHGNQLDLGWIRHLAINPQTIRRWKDQAIRWAGFALPFVYFIFYLAGKLLQALFFSLVLAYSHRTMRESGMTYARILNVAIYALTPPAIFAAIMQIAGIQVPYLEWVFLGMYVAFLMGAMNACTPKPVSGQTNSDLQDQDIDF